ncbi:gpW family protein [Paraburkholderia adhaesiva]|uniref:gpW family protein n=1 Tax=Paraburkholderia adhaesiva TaxID=2883244 RepID=UPI001F2A2D21|nr:gpW family protein [Paraburkholderia adhaesiva]
MNTPHTFPFRACDCYHPSQSIFAGMTTAQLQAALAAAQAAYVKLMTGGQGVSFSYTQGDGTRSVTYTAANPANLAAFIRQLQAQLGLVCRGRAPVRLIYR